MENLAHLNSEGDERSEKPKEGMKVIQIKINGVSKHSTVTPRCHCAVKYLRDELRLDGDQSSGCGMALCGLARCTRTARRFGPALSPWVH